MSVSALSPAVQHSIINAANLSVSCFAKAFCDKLGRKHFFTQEDIEDIAGVVILKAWRSYETFDPEKGKIATWIKTIAFNCVKDAIKYKIKRLPISYSLYAENPETGDEYCVDEYCDENHGLHSEKSEMLCEFSADSGILQKEFEISVKQEVSKLSEKNQRFADMLIEGYAPREMAIIEGCTANAASKRIWEIRQTLRPLLAKAC